MSGGGKKDKSDRNKRKSLPITSKSLFNGSINAYCQKIIAPLYCENNTSSVPFEAGVLNSDGL